MSEENKVILKKRFMSFVWRFGAVAGVAIAAFIGDNLELINMSPQMIGFAGLVLGEITKWLNTKK